MKQCVAVSLLGILLAACGATGSTTQPSTSQGARASSPPASVLPTASAVAASPPAASTATSAQPSAGAGSFILCPAPGAGATCPLPPGQYTAAIHDAFALTITDAGWQEERSPAASEEEPTLILSRIDAPDQRLTIDTGQTGLIRDAKGMTELLAGTTSIQTGGPPTEAHAGDAVGYGVVLAPQQSTPVTISRAGTYTFEPGHRYRLMALQFPMNEESAIKVIIADAPTATFDGFLPKVDAILGGLTWQ